MANVAILIASILLVGLMFISWRARALAAREAERLRAEAARGREVESIAMDSASLLSATLMSLETAHERATSSEARGPIEDARASASALASLFSAARVYQQEGDDLESPPGEGCVRLAVAIARSRGLGVSIHGHNTSLGVQRDPRAACELVVQIIAACGSALGPDECVEVEFGPDAVSVTGGSGGAVAAPTERAAELGWSAKPLPDGRGVLIEALRSDDQPARNLVLSVGKSVH